MTDSSTTTTTPDEPRFTWHPEYAGKSIASVQRDMADEIRRDQKAYELALEGAEKEEYDSFNSIRDIEKRWSEYDFGWMELDANLLAARITKFEQTRDEKQELISWNDWRYGPKAEPTEDVPSANPGVKTDWRENLTDEQRRKLASGLAVGVIFLMVVIIVGLAMLIL